MLFLLGCIEQDRNFITCGLSEQLIEKNMRLAAQIGEQSNVCVDTRDRLGNPSLDS